MSSIADKFKKFLPLRSDDVTISASNAAAMSLEHTETLQPTDERTVLLRRESANEAAAVAEQIPEPPDTEVSPDGHADFVPSRDFDDGFSVVSPSTRDRSSESEGDGEEGREQFHRDRIFNDCMGRMIARASTGYMAMV